MIGGTFIHRLGLGHRWSVFLSFSSLFLCCFFSFGDIRLGWLYCFVWVEKKVLLQIGVFNTQTIVEFFWEVCYYFCARLDLRTRKFDHHQRRILSSSLHTCIYRLVGGIGSAQASTYIFSFVSIFYCLILLYLWPLVYRFLGVKWGLRVLLALLFSSLSAYLLGGDLVFNCLI